MNKLLEIQRKLVVIKSEFNAFGKYNYRTTESIMLALKPLLIETNTTLVVTDGIEEVAGNVYIKASAILKHENEYWESSSYARDGITQKGMNASQVTNSASSFARKQALSGLFLIDDTSTTFLSNKEQEQQENERQKTLKDSFNKVDSIQKLMKIWETCSHEEKETYLKDKESAKLRLGEKT